MRNDRDYWTIQAMLKYGGSFVQKLAALAESADLENLAKIKFTWRNYWIEHEIEGELLQRQSQK